MKFKFLLIIALTSSLGIAAQTKNNYASIDNRMNLIPDSMTTSTQHIGEFICKNFSNQNDKVRAAYYWVAKNIQYDIKNMFVINFHENKNETIEKVLKTRKGVCLDYAVLFTEIATKTGLKAYEIDGFTKQNGFVDYVPHAWCAVLIDSTWCLFDPTWGSGYAQKSKFISQLNNIYFKTKPESLIKSHFPFDPQWQFLDYPFNTQEFYEGKAAINSRKKYFNFNDSIASYGKLAELDQLIVATPRIEKNGAINSIVFDRLQYNKREIEYLKNKFISEQFNLSVNYSNTGIGLLNAFINYRNKHFIPLKSDPELKLMLDTIETSFNLSKEHIKLIKNPDSSTQTSLKQLNQSIEEAYLNFNEQKTFLNKYLATSKIFRKSSFYKFSWMGIPLN